MISKKNYQRQCPVCQHEILFSINHSSKVFKFAESYFRRDDNNNILYPEDPYLEIFCSWDCTHGVKYVFTEEEKEDIKSNLIKLIKLENLLKVEETYKNKEEILEDITFNESLDYFQRTHKHIQEVGEGINRLIKELNFRILEHDKSKIEDEDEIKGFINLNKDKQKSDFKFGSYEYKNALNRIKKVVEKHYSKNKHHPEYWDNKISDMDLIDIMEMLCDWASDCKRDKDGDIMNTIDICCKKFKIDPQLRGILEKTAINYFPDKVFNAEVKNKEI